MELIQFVKDQLRDQFSDEYEEFDKVSLKVKDDLVIDKIGAIEWYKEPVEKEKKTVQPSFETKEGIGKNTQLEKKSTEEQEILGQVGHVEHSSTRFFVDEKMYRKLISNLQLNFILTVTPNKGKHPKGVYTIPNQVIVNYIETKRAAYNWQQNKTYHQDSIPKDLRAYFKYR